MERFPINSGMHCNLSNNVAKYELFTCMCYIFIDWNQQTFFAQMTSFVMRHDIIYHFFPISSQYLMLWGGGGGSGSPETKLSTVMRCPSKIFYTVHMLGTLGFTGSEHWAPFNFPQSTALESVCINGVTVLSGLNLERIQGLSFPMANQTVHSYEMFIFGGYPQSRV